MSETIRVAINGAHGKMGEETQRAIRNADGLELVACLDIGDDLAARLAENRPDVVVDFTRPDTIHATIRTILQAGCHAVVGTTGIHPHEVADFKFDVQATQRSVLICPNFSIGAVLIMQAAAQIARHLTYVEIIERHHEKKVDAPSGTALKAADVIASAMPTVNADVPTSQELVSGSRGGVNTTGIPIHAMRLPGHLAQLDICFGGPGQRVTLSHDTLDRGAFMPGVLLAVRWMMQHPPSVRYGLESIMEETQ
ncbi:MAG: 4-hydroxy-tetrahydrodipicolinate reductase [Planctomycetes bacterium]|nr:4-hydroxy-tetrahydrodipicolinate reductase [Planctomycetota bacterium]